MCACARFLVKSTGRRLHPRLFRRFFSDGPVVTARDSLREVLETPVDDIPTRTEITRNLAEKGAFWKHSEYGRFVRTDCDECGGELTSHVSTVDGLMTCTVCHHEQPFVNYKKRVTVRKTETTREDEVKREEEKRIEETLRRMDSPEEYDSDIHDQVSYLNLMQFKEKEAGKRRDRMKALRVRDDTDAPSPRGITGEGGSAAPTVVDPNIAYLWNDGIDIGDLSGVEQSIVMQLRIHLGIERISTDTLTRYNVRAHMDNYDQPGILYPRYKGMSNRMRPPAGLKVIRKIGEKLEKENYPMPDETMVTQRFSGMFGYHMMSSSDRTVVLTTNERDALAVYEATNGFPALALPQGERMDTSVLPYLEDFEKIYIWFPERHLEYAKEWGFALNGSRCFLVKWEDRPIELVRNENNKAVKRILTNKAVRMRDKGFRSMTDVRDEVKADLLHASSRLYGFAQWKRFSPLNKYLQGLRPGEMTVLTGGTGQGKTTFLCEYSLDLFTQGVRTLFCSFEMPEEKILRWMVLQYAGPSFLRSLARTLTYRNGVKKPLYRVEFSEEIDQWLDKFARVRGPLTIMQNKEFTGRSIGAMAKAIHDHVVSSGVQHVVIDNLQFLVNQATLSDEKAGSFEKFNLQDHFVGKMRKLATEEGVHITMVVHPRKTEAEGELDIQHFGGTSRVTQEADNVLAIQRRRDDKDRAKFRKFLYILKNRYGGRRVESDQLEMVFNPSTYSHTLVDHSR